ncbi:ABC transporter permease [bacterium]|nr:ABC transporter permease [bacterium]
MSIWKLILREIFYRKGNFAMALLSVTAAVSCLIGTLTLLRVDQARTDELLAEKEATVELAGSELVDAMRKITKGLGFNVVILPEDQDLNEMHLEGSLSKSMPEEYVDRLAKSDIVTINHLLPTVMKKLTWPEKDFPVIVYGTRGEVPIQHRDLKKPLLDAVPQGKMIVGFEVGEKLGLSVGDDVVLLGADFSIAKKHPQRGTVDDSTVWINLAQAQDLFGMKNLVHAIQALECYCVGDRITEIRKEIAGILPGTQVIERGQPALARAEARGTAKESAEASLNQEKEAREDLRRQREQFAAILVPVALLASAMWIGFLAFANVRQRRYEVGVLRSIGYGTSHILGLFLGKSLLVAMVGAAIGSIVGFFIGVESGSNTLASSEILNLFTPIHLGIAFVLAIFLSVAGSWIPAVMAVRQDPALILQGD